MCTDPGGRQRSGPQSPALLEMITRMGDCASAQRPVKRPCTPLDSKRCSVQSHLPPSPSSLRIDEDWLQQWIAFGMLDMAIYLTKQARFAAYLARRDQGLKRPARAKKR
jgi:hypothetical protein